MFAGVHSPVMVQRICYTLVAQTEAAERRKYTRARLLVFFRVLYRCHKRWTPNWEGPAWPWVYVPRLASFLCIPVSTSSIFILWHKRQTMLTGWIIFQDLVYHPYQEFIAGTSITWQNTEKAGPGRTYYIRGGVFSKRNSRSDCLISYLTRNHSLASCYS